MLSISKHERKYGKGDQFFIHEHGFNELLLCTEGRAYELSSSGKRFFEAKELFFYPAGFPHNTHSYQKTSYTCFVLSFTDSCLKELKETSRPFSILKTLERQVSRKNDTRIPLKSGNLRKLELLFSDLLDNQYDVSGNGNWENRLIFEQILLNIDKGIRGDKTQKKSDDKQRIIRKVCDYIDLNYDSPIQVDDILKYCPLSRSHFFSVFKQETGQTFNSYLLSVRLEHACNCLKNTDLSITEIAFKCGFNSYSHFCYTFKKLKKIPPSEYQRQNK